LHRQNVRTRWHQREGGDAAGAIKPRGDDARMHEAILLGEVGRIDHRQIDCARLETVERDAEHLHRPLRLERRGRHRAIIRILRLELLLHADVRQSRGWLRPDALPPLREWRARTAPTCAPGGPYAPR